jgi:hypothetical protein
MSESNKTTRVPVSIRLLAALYRILDALLRPVLFVFSKINTMQDTIHLKLSRLGRPDAAFSQWRDKQARRKARGGR